MLENISYNQHAETILFAHRSYRLEATTAFPGREKGEMSTPLDRVTLQGDSTVALTYSSSMMLNTDEDDKLGMLRALVTNLLTDQGINTKVATDNGEIDISSLTPEEAEVLVADNGYFGVEQTSERIFQFAVGVAGGDPSRIEAIKQGIDMGFQQAVEAFGGTLPDISYQTYDAVLEKLNNWVEESQAVA